MNQVATQQDEEFLPLPYFSWDERPDHIPLTHDECATAIYLAEGSIPRAAGLLKVGTYRLDREIRRSPKLQLIRDEAAQVVVRRAEAELIAGLDAPDDRRREWAANKILNSRAASQSPFAPNPSNASSSTSLTLSQPGRTMTFRWRTDEDAPINDEPDRTIIDP